MSVHEHDYVRPFLVELIRAGSILAEVLDNLLESLGEDDLSGESAGDALMEMLTGTLRPVIERVGEDPVRQVTPLFDACVEQTLRDLRRALELARPRP